MLPPDSVKGNLQEMSTPREELENLLRRDEQEQQKKEGERVPGFEASRSALVVVEGAAF